MDYARPLGREELDAMYGSESERSDDERANAYELTNFTQALNVKHLSLSTQSMISYKWANFMLPRTIKFVTIEYKKYTR